MLLQLWDRLSVSRDARRGENRRSDTTRLLFIIEELGGDRYEGSNPSVIGSELLYAVLMCRS